MRIVTRILKFVGIGIAALLGLLIVALVSVKLYLNDERLASFAVGKLNGLFAGRFSVRTVHWTLPFHFVLEDVAVDDPIGRPAIRATRVDATFDAKALLAGTIAIRDIAGHGLDVRLVSMPEAPDDMGLVEAFGPKTPAPEPDETSSSSIRLRVEGPLLTDVEFTYDMPDVRFVLSGGRLENAGYGMHGDAMDIDGHVEVARADVDIAGLRYDGPIILTARGVVLDLGPSGAPADVTVDTEEVHVNLAGLEVTTKGSLVFPATEPLPQGTVALHGTVPLDHPLVKQYLTGRDRGTLALELDATREGDKTLVSGTIDGDNAVVSGIPFDQLGIDAVLEKDRIDMRRVSATFDNGSATVSGEVAMDEPMAHDLTIDFERFPLKRILDAVTEGIPAPTRLSGRARANGPGLVDLNTHLEADLRASGLPDDLAGVPDPLRLTVEAHVNMQRADVASLTVTGDGARLDLSGVVPFDPEGRFDTKLELTHSRPDATLAATGGAPFSLTGLEVTAHAKGTLADLTADALIDAHGVRAQDVGPADVHVPLHMEHGTATITDALVTLQQGALHLDASVGVLDARGSARSEMPLAARVHATDIDLEPLTRHHASGSLVVDAEVGGTVQAPTGRARLGVDGLTANGVAFEKAEARVSIGEQRATLDELILDPKDGGKLTARGSYALTDSKFDATLDIDDLPLHSILVLAAPDVPLRGTLVGQVHAAGTAEAPRLDGSLTIEELASGPIDLGELSLDFDTRRDAVHGVATLTGPLGTAKLDASVIPKSTTFHAQLDVTDVTLARALKAANLPLPLDGSLALHAKADGTLPYPKLVARLDVSDLLVEGVHPEPDTLTLEITTEADASYVASLAFGHILSAKAHAWPRKDTIDLDASFEEFKASAFSASLQRQGLDLLLSGGANVHYRGPSTIDGSLTLETLEARIQHESVKLAQPTTVRFDGTTVRVPRTVFEGAGSTLALQGTLAGSKIDGDIRGDMNLAVLGPFVTAVSDPSGVLHLEARASGTTDAPELIGKISVAREVHFQPRGIPQEVDLREGTITLTPDRVEIDGLAGRLEDGSFKVDGRIGLADFTPNSYDVWVEGKKLTFQSREMRVEADTKLHLTGAGKLVPDVSGDIVVVTGRYLKKFALKDFNFIGKAPDTSAPLSQTAPELAQMKLDLHATNGEDIEVKVDASAFAITLPLQIDLRIQGTPLAPSVGGRVTAQAGSIKFPEATLNIVETLVTFTPGLPPADGANLTLIAEGEVPSKTDDTTVDELYLVQMSLSGTLAALTFDLSAAPGLDRNQTLALLITGKAGFDQLFYGQGTTTGTSSGNSTSPEVDAAVALAGAGVTGPLTGFVENQLEDRLNLKVDLSASVTTDQVRVTARKELTPRLRIEGSVQRALQYTGNNLNVATATYILANRWFLQAIAQSATGNAVSNDPTVVRPRSDSRLEMKYRLVGD